MKITTTDKIEVELTEREALYLSQALFSVGSDHISSEAHDFSYELANQLELALQTLVPKQ